MVDAARRFARKHPSLTLFIGGVFLCVSPIGISLNLMYLIEHDLIADRYWPLFQRAAPIIRVLTLLANLAGFILFSISALLAVRRSVNQRIANPISDDQTP